MLQEFELIYGKVITTAKKIIPFIFILQIGLTQNSNIGVPPIRNYEKEYYKAGSQNWDIAQDESGFIYIANNDGLLHFDGVNWSTFPVSNKTICRSLSVSNEGSVYVGAQGEFGFFFPEANGVLEYNSLVSLIPEEHRDFEDVWNIVRHERSVFFRTSKKVYQLIDNEIKVYDFDQDLLFMGSSNGQLLIEKENGSLVKFDKNEFVPFAIADNNLGIVTACMDFGGDSILFATLKNAFFLYDGLELRPWETSFDSFLKNKRIFCAAKSKKSGQIAVGTSSEGMLILNSEGEAIRHLSRSQGLQNNNVLSIFFDQSENLWLGQNNGIDYVEQSSPITKVFPDQDLKEPVYAARVFDGFLYLGTSNGLYRILWKEYYDPFENVLFEKVEHTDGQVWALEVINNALFMGHHEGAFLIEGRSAKQISSIPGSWNFLEYGDNSMMIGSYAGINVFEKKGTNWNFKHSITDFSESSRLLAIDALSEIWVAHPYKGVYRISTNERGEETEVRQYGSEDGLSSDLFNHLFIVNDEVVFTSETDAYRYNQMDSRFEVNQDYAELFGPDLRIKQLTNDEQGNIWFAANDNVGMLDIKDQGLSKEVNKKMFPLLKGKLLGGFELIYPIDAYNVFFGADKGAFHLNPSYQTGKDPLFQVHITSVRGTWDRDSLIFGGNYTNSSNSELMHEKLGFHTFRNNENSFSFGFSNNSFQDVSLGQYQYFLEGLDKSWSNWTNKSEKEFTNLSPGTYVFHVKAIDIHGYESAQKEFSFEIKSPWYGTGYAFAVYLTLLLGMILGLPFIQRKIFTKERREMEQKRAELEQLREKEAVESEKAIVQLKNDNLKTEIQFKNKELALTTMHLVQKMEMFKKIQSDLMKATTADTENKKLRTDVQKVIRLLNSDEQFDNEWEQFAYHFDEVHQNFFLRLSQLYPQISPNDHRLSAYLRMNLSTKEIAHLLNLSVRGVEASRYRLRKKMKLASDINLTDFMMKF